MSEHGHKIIKCVCGRVLAQCRCAIGGKTVETRKPCHCPEAETKPERYEVDAGRVNANLSPEVMDQLQRIEDYLHSLGRMMRKNTVICPNCKDVSQPWSCMG